MRVLVGLVLIGVAGCAALEQLDPVDTVLRDAVTIARTTPAEQKSALAGAQQSFVSDTSALNRLRLATLLASRPAPLRDDARAAELLEPIANPNGSGVGRFAAFLGTQLAERQRVVRELERLAKERAALEKDRAAFEKDRVERDKREEALKQQLEALRAIERGILDREERMRGKPGARQ